MPEGVAQGVSGQGHRQWRFVRDGAARRRPTSRIWSLKPCVMVGCGHLHGWTAQLSLSRLSICSAAVGSAAASKLFMRYRPTELLGEVELRDATWRGGDQIVSTRYIKVGDRAFGMDPLSSQGIQAALRSGIQASAVVHTILSGGNAGAALRFYSESQRSAVAQHCRATSAAYADQKLYSSSFWQQRASGAVSRLPQAAPVPLVTPETRLRLATDARVVDVPALDGDLICNRPALVHPALERPVAWFAGTATGAILGDFKDNLTASAVVSDWSRQMTPTAASDALSWLIERGIIVRSEERRVGKECRSRWS